MAVAGIALVVAALILAESGGGCAHLNDRALQFPSTVPQQMGGNEVVAIVGCEEITLAEFREMVQRQGYMREVSQRELDGLLKTGLPTDYLQARQDIAAFWGMDNGALGVLILNSALYQEAVHVGTSVRPGEVEESVSLTREWYETGEMDPYTVGYMESIGEDRWWEEVLPQRTYRDLMIGKLDGDAFDASVPPEAERWDWHDFVDMVLEQTDVRVVDSERHGATLEGVMGQLSSVRVLDRSWAREPDSLPRAPDGRWVVYFKPEHGYVHSIHVENKPAHCSQVSTGSRRICDGRSGEPLLEIAPGDLFVIVQPGSILPEFDAGR